VDQVEQRVEVEGTEEEKEDLLPKLVGLRKAISDMTEHYDAKLSEVKERNQQALAELKKLQNRVKCAHERAPPAAASPSGKENRQQTPDNESEDAPGIACCPQVFETTVQDMDNQGPLIVPQPHPMWEAYTPCCTGVWTTEYGPEWHWWGACSGPDLRGGVLPGSSVGYGSRGLSLQPAEPGQLCPDAVSRSLELAIEIQRVIAPGAPLPISLCGDCHDNAVTTELLVAARWPSVSASARSARA
jgi:hypothetical protein